MKDVAGIRKAATANLNAIEVLWPVGIVRNRAFHIAADRRIDVG